MRSRITKIGRQRRSPLFIGEWMEVRGISDEKMAGRVGVDRVTITRWRSQQHRLNPEKIAAIAAALDIEPHQLWFHPARPSVDALLAGADDKMRERAAEPIGVILKTGT